MSQVILCNLSNINEVIDEARTEWVYETLFNAGVNEEILMLDDIREYRAAMYDIGIEVQYIHSGEVNIYKLEWFEDEYSAGFLSPQKKHLIAQWYNPDTTIKIDKDRNAYYEIHPREWSIFKMRE